MSSKKEKGEENVGGIDGCGWGCYCWALLVVVIVWMCLGGHFASWVYDCIGAENVMVLVWTVKGVLAQVRSSWSCFKYIRGLRPLFQGFIKPPNFPKKIKAPCIELSRSHAVSDGKY